MTWYTHYIIKLFIMPRKIKRLFIFILVCSVLTFVWLIWDHQADVKTILLPPFVDTEGCVIPYHNPFDPSIHDFIFPSMDLKCYEYPPLTFQEGQMLKVNRELRRVFKYCEYQEITLDYQDDWHYTISSKKVQFTDDVSISVEFIRVICYRDNGEHMYTNFHAFVIFNRTRLEKLQEEVNRYQGSNKPKEVISVLLIGVDSISRLNNIRHMPKTRRFLINEMSAIDFQGYMKVADNTFVNMVPMLTGSFFSEEMTRTKTRREGPFDQLNFIWKNFSAAGYTTMMMEDFPGGTIFNYLSYGFTQPPVDHYPRPFSLALEKDSSAWPKGKDSNCVWDRSETKVVLDYVYDFVKIHRHYPYFGIAFISRMTHDVLENAAYVDDDYFKMLVKLNKENLLNNTILLFFGDHGLRYGKFLQTYIGQIELRMPMMYLVFPTWFHKKYPQIIQNVKENSRKLTSVFDIHETLKNIINFTGHSSLNVDVSQRGISLLDKIPETRTCDDAGVSPHWCLCNPDETNIPHDDPMAIKCANFLSDKINKLLVNYPMCKPLEYTSIQYLKHFRTKVNWGNSNKANIFYRIYLTMQPGDGEFEATLNYISENDSFTMAGEISRNSYYGKTSLCVEDHELRKYCFCK